MVGTFIITSAAYADPDFVSTFGLLPPAFLPVGNKRLYQVQANLISHLKCRKLLSIPSNFDIPENELANISDLGFELIKVPLELSLGASVSNVLKQAELTEGELRILHGDTLVKNFPFEKLDVVSEGMTTEYFSWAEYRINSGGEIKFFDGLMEGSAINSSLGERNVLSGYFSFSDAEFYQLCLERAQSNFIFSLNEYSRERTLSPIKEGNWLDFGHLDKYYQSKAQMTTERAFNKIRVSSRTVKKSSEDKDKIHAEASWFTNLPEPLKVFLPQFLGEFTQGKSSGYETEYLYLSTLSDLYVFGRLPTYVWQRIFQSCDDFLTAGKNFKPIKPQPSYDRLYRDKTMERLELYATQSIVDLNRNWRYKNKLLPSLEAIVELTANAIPSVIPDYLHITHGDFCFSNIFYDFRANIIRLVDPRGMGPDETATIYGDVRYDIAKLFHSVVGGYDLIICDRYNLEDDGKYELTLTLPEDQNAKERQTIFRNRSFAGHSIASASAQPISILLFLSMLPLHHDHPARQRAFLANALRLFVDLDE